MSEKEKIIEKIGWFKIIFGLSAAVDIPLIAWLFRNFDAVSSAQRLIALCLATVMICVMIGINLWVFRKLDRLGEL